MQAVGLFPDDPQPSQFTPFPYAGCVDIITSSPQNTWRCDIVILSLQTRKPRFRALTDWTETQISPWICRVQLDRGCLKS